MLLFTGYGLELLLRWLHFLSGITWIGLLYYFNFVQGPFFAEADAATKSAATQKLVPRALWWFRWAAMLTFLSGLAILLKRGAAGAGVWNTPWGVAILTGAAFGTLMFLNVWLVIWPNQKIVIASATAVAGGGPADPRAAAAGRRAFLASRSNVVLSFPMLFFMGAASHLPFNIVGSTGWYALLIAAVLVLVEANALAGSSGPMKQPLETVSSVITTGLVVAFVVYGLLVGVLA
ncbi:MAG: urate hydroxylase PuuD [Gemmatimonadetes bacterium]|nr:urate hydroxylase PuuD [Gemmatimonadota bacterium]